MKTRVKELLGLAGDTNKVLFFGFFHFDIVIIKR